MRRDRLAAARKARWGNKTPLQRVVAKLLIGPGLSPCWIWAGYCNRKGYGRFKVDGALMLVHRYTYHRFIGKAIPDGWTIDHLCRNRACCNPSHLEAVPHAMNCRRGSVATATHCKRGHPLSGNNLRVRQIATGRTTRTCKACYSLGVRRRYRNSPAYKGNGSYRERDATTGRFISTRTEAA